MVKACTVIENCTYYVISEPSFFNAIRKTYLLTPSVKPTYTSTYLVNSKYIEDMFRKSVFYIFI